MNLEIKFLHAMRQAGFEPDCQIIADARLHRFRDWLDKPGTKNCWYIIFPDRPPTGAYGCWRRGIHETWVGSVSTNDHLAANRLKSINRIIAKKLEHGRMLAEEILQKAAPANGNHRYLIKKKVGAHGIFYLRGALLIPLRDMDGQIHGLQRIFPDGSKRFTRGTNKSGHFHLLGTPKENILCIAEGYATAATIYEISAAATAVAFDTGNLLPVAEAFRAAYSEIEIVICADFDRFTPGNPGMKFALKASDAVGGRIVWPRFSDFNSRGSDINDLYLEEGEDAVLNCFRGTGGYHV